MTIDAVIPYWAGYVANPDDVKNRGLIETAGKKVIDRTVEVLRKIEKIEKVIIYSNDRDIFLHLLEIENVEIRARPTSLDNPESRIEDVVTSFLATTEASTIVMCHPKCPLILPSSIEKCIDEVASGHFDTATCVKRVRDLAWYKSVPLNYSLGSKIPKANEIEQIIIEAGGVYVFQKDKYLKHGSRLHGEIYFHGLSNIEAIEVSSSEDIELLELIINSGLVATGVSDE